MKRDDDDAPTRAPQPLFVVSLSQGVRGTTPEFQAGFSQPRTPPPNTKTQRFLVETHLMPSSLGSTSVAHPLHLVDRILRWRSNFVSYCLLSLVIVALGCSPLGVPIAIMPKWDVFDWDGTRFDEFTFDAVFWVVFVAAATALSLGVVWFRRDPQPRGLHLYGNRYLFIAVASILCLAQLFGYSWYILSYFYDFIKHHSLRRRGAHAHQSKKQLLTIQWTRSVALTLGILGAWTAGLSLLPVSRCSPIMAALGIPLDACLRAHAILGRLTVLFLTAHFVGYVVAWKLDGGWSEAWQNSTEWQERGINNMCGVIGWIFLVVALFMIALGYVRKKAYEVFYVFHIVGLLGFVGYGCMHWAGFVNYLATAIALWVADIGRRILEAASPVIIDATCYPKANLVQLRIPDTKLPSAALNRNPSTSLFVSLYVPAVSLFEWHPFSCCQQADSFECWIRALGGWTRNLLNVAQATNAPLKAAVNGVYHSGWPVSLAGSQVLLVAGGTGIVPFLDFLQRRETRTLTLIWAIRHIEDIEILRSFAASRLKGKSGDAEDPGTLELVVYYTGTADIAEVEEALDKIAAGPQADEAEVHSGSSARILGFAIILALHAVAFSGVVVGLYWAQETTENVKQRWRSGLISVVLTTVSAIVPTLALVIFLAFSRLTRRPAFERVEQDVAKTAVIANPLTATPPSKGDSNDGGVAMTAVNPVIVTTDEPWTSVVVIAGRPDIEGHLESAAVNPGTLKVLASGPTGLVNATRRACLTKGCALGKPNLLVDFDVLSYDIADL